MNKPPTNPCYEVPLNEIMRACLRFEHLFKQTRHYLTSDKSYDHQVALTYVLEILNLADRPDLRTKFSKAVNEHIASLSQLSKIPDIDQHKLREVLNKLQHASHILHQNQGKMSKVLRTNEFLFTIGQRLSTPGGTAPCYLAPYYLWQNLPAETRKKDLQLWFNKLLELEEVIDLLLSLTRDSAEFKTKMASNGFYQLALDSSVPYQLLRLEIPLQSMVYPEISVGRHRMAVHFFVLDVHGHATQAPYDIEFKLSCCKI